LNQENLRGRFLEFGIQGISREVSTEIRREAQSGLPTRRSTED